MFDASEIEISFADQAIEKKIETDVTEVDAVAAAAQAAATAAAAAQDP